MEKLISCAAFILFLTLNVYAQTSITLQGEVVDKETYEVVPHAMIINVRNNTGTLADNAGKFTIKILSTDTIAISSIGYGYRKISFADSSIKDTIKVRILLSRLYITLREVAIYPERTIDEIEKDIQKLGVKKNYSVQGGINAAQSPITYLYERFSKFSKSQQKVAEWENEELKRELLKELFRLYIKYDIINLSDAEFEAFIKYLNLSDEFIKNSSQLELVLAIKGKYESFRYRWK